MVHCRKVRFALFWNFTGILGREIGLGWVPWETHTSQIEGMGKGWEEEEVFKLGLCAAVLSPSSLETYMRTPHWGVAVQPLLILSWNFKVIPNGSRDSQGQLWYNRVYSVFTSPDVLVLVMMNNDASDTQSTHGRPTFTLPTALLVTRISSHYPTFPK